MKTSRNIHNILLFSLFLTTCLPKAYATPNEQHIQEVTPNRTHITSPDGQLSVTVSDSLGMAWYSVSYDGTEVMPPARLGLKANYADLSENLTLKDSKTGNIDQHYTMTRTKKSNVHYQASTADITFANDKGQEMVVTFQVSANDIAFRYTLKRPKGNNPKMAIVNEELTAFQFPSSTTTFLSPQIQPMAGWEKSKPSYEEEYVADAALTAPSKYGVGYTFPALFHEHQTLQGEDCWILISETGLTGDYCGGRLSEYHPNEGYRIAYPQAGECFGWGSAQAAISLPGSTPWRTITLGRTLAPIVETTVPYDVVEQRYEPKADYRPGRYTWSWIIWQDASVNYDDQKQFIDLAAKMGYEYVLVDALWDQQIGREGIERLANYARSKNVALMLWYNSNGLENNAPQTPRNIMNRPIERKKAMAWMQRIGVKGIKVDFFGGDKQHVIQLYEDILSDANDYGLQVIFHGCTIPRGWERMYPNYVASEAALASENVYFSEDHARKEGFEMTMHPFARNAVASFDWGGVIMNHHMSRDNKSRHPRHTTDVFEMATAITNQTSVNCVALTPNVVDQLPTQTLDFLRQLPTTWEDTRFIDGYPTRYAVIARQHDGRWYVGGLNGTQKTMKLKLQLPMLKGKTVDYYYDSPEKNADQPKTVLRQLKVNKRGEATVTLQPMGGIILVEK
jgi:hypothetical protein